MRQGPRTAVVATTAAFLIVVGAGPASAAEDPIALSLDGATFARELPDALFAGARIVPGSTLVRSFWVKNQQTTDGTLALAVQDVAGPGEFLTGLTISATGDGAASQQVGLADAAPCTPLFSAVPLPAGGIARIEVSLSLADLDGLQAQGAVGDFSLRVTLTSADVSAPDGCGSTPATPAPPVGPPPAPPGPGPGGGSVLIDGTGGGPITPPPGEGGGGGTRDPGADPPGDRPGKNGNTVRLHQELFVAAWLAGMLGGGAAAWAWRRRDSEEDA